MRSAVDGLHLRKIFPSSLAVAEALRSLELDGHARTFCELSQLQLFGIAALSLGIAAPIASEVKSEVMSSVNFVVILCSLCPVE